MIRYLALGDSYTVGEEVSADQSFPYQLLYGMNGLKAKNAELKIIAVTGWTTSDLLDATQKEDPTPGTWSFVSLLIGVNNQYQGKPFELYQQEFSALLNIAIELMEGDVGKVVVVSIPDYGVTPFAQESDQNKITSEIHQYNRYAHDKTIEAGAQWIYITDISLQAADNEELITGDGLHPSGIQYGLWVKEIIPVVRKIIDDE
ncbi:MAG: SGNH/GDSL hydrolase family protein [Saprospiraceae bacterium]|nr:SGNH/GDSL hydrolase family protein [Saprospiraceae bacterium]